MNTKSGFKKTTRLATMPDAVETAVRIAQESLNMSSVGLTMLGSCCCMILTRNEDEGT